MTTLAELDKRVAKLEAALKRRDSDTILTREDRVALRAADHAKRNGTLVEYERLKQELDGA